MVRYRLKSILRTYLLSILCLLLAPIVGVLGAEGPPPVTATTEAQIYSSVSLQKSLSSGSNFWMPATSDLLSALKNGDRIETAKDEDFYELDIEVISEIISNTSSFDLEAFWEAFSAEFEATLDESSRAFMIEYANEIELLYLSPSEMSDLLPGQ